MTLVSYLVALLTRGASVLLSGPPGCGKTALVGDVASRAGYRLAVGIGGRPCDVLDRLDVAGAIMPDAASGTSRLLPLAELRDVLDSPEPTLWFLDELGRAPVDVQGALCGRIDWVRRSNPNVVVWAATNRPQDRAGVGTLIEPLRSRLDHAYAMPMPVWDGERLTPYPTDGAALPLCEYRELTDAWCAWADSAGLPSDVVSWHHATAGEQLYTWRPSADPAARFADFRGWQTVCRALAAGDDSYRTIASAIGQPAAALFLAYRGLSADLPTIDAILADPANAPVPSMAQQNAMFFVAGQLVSVADAKNIGAVLTYLQRMPRVFAAYAATSIYRRHGAAIASAPEFRAYWLANQALFSRAAA